MATFTGERPGRGSAYAYDDSRHRVAYLEAAEFIRDRVVIDAGSGDGEGTALLAEVADRVIGLDHEEDAIADAERSHGAASVSFRRADLAETWPTGDVQADVVVAFQVIEHLEDDSGFVRNALEALPPGGTLLLTTPNRLTSFSENPYHVREYEPDELRSLLLSVADDVTLRGVFGNARVRAFDERRRAEVERWLRLDPLRLRDRLPRRVVEVAFASLSTLVRRRARDEDRDQPITVEDFHVGDEGLEDCLDLWAVVRRGAV